LFREGGRDCELEPSICYTHTDTQRIHVNPLHTAHCTDYTGVASAGEGYCCSKSKGGSGSVTDQVADPGLTVFRAVVYSFAFGSVQVR